MGGTVTFGRSGTGFPGNPGVGGGSAAHEIEWENRTTTRMTAKKTSLSFLAVLMTPPPIESVFLCVATSFEKVQRIYLFPLRVRHSISPLVDRAVYLRGVYGSLR